MVLPRWLARANRAVTNPLLRSLVGVGWMAELEHKGRSSNRRYHTVLMVFGRATPSRWPSPTDPGSTG